MEADEVAVAQLERRERGGERFAEVDTEALADQRELGIDEANRLRSIGGAVFSGRAVSAAAAKIGQRATRDDLQPGEQRPAAAELLDPRRDVDEQPRREDLAQLVEQRGLGLLAVEQARELGHDLAVEHGDRGGVAITARAREVQVPDVQRGERGARFGITDDARGEKPREPVGLDADRGPSGSTFGDARGELRSANPPRSINSTVSWGRGRLSG